MKECGSNYKFEYNMTDHLGNVRAAFIGQSSGVPLVAQRSSYFPFGMVAEQTNAYTGSTLENKYLYNGKELQNDEVAGVKLEWYDYGARMYDAELGRWHVVDPMAESFYSQSPYHFSGNNPIRFLDLNGMNYDEWDYDVDSRKMTWVSDKGGNETQHVNVIKDGKQQGEARVSGNEVFVSLLSD